MVRTCSGRVRLWSQRRGDAERDISGARSARTGARRDHARGRDGPPVFRACARVNRQGAKDAKVRREIISGARSARTGARRDHDRPLRTVRACSVRVPELTPRRQDAKTAKVRGEIISGRAFLLACALVEITTVRVGRFTRVPRVLQMLKHEATKPRTHE